MKNTERSDSVTFDEYREKYGIKLNEQQERAVLRAEGNTLLLAVPGSGKTTVIVSRLGYMINCLGIPYSAILTLTYSVASCRDMRERYISYFGDSYVPQFRTIHGICSIIIKEFERLTGRCAFKLMSGEESENDVLSHVFRKVCGTYPETGQINELKTYITYIRNMMLDTHKASELFDVKYDICAVIREYRREKQHRRLMDYDDQLEFAYRILKQHPEMLDRFRKQYRYINVDEAQDTSKIQHEIIGLLASGNLFMVGDEDQSIYGFRAAYPRALLDFEKRYKDAVVLFMEQNFRSTGHIIKRASRLISTNRDRRRKNMFTDKDDGDDIEIINLPSRKDQYSVLCKAAREVCGSSETTAVLFRNNDSALPLIARLEKCGIPYRYREADCPFFENPGICDILALTDVLYDNNAESFMYVAKRLGCGLRDDEIRRMVAVAGRASFSAVMKRFIPKDDERSKRIYELCDTMEKAKLQRPADAISLLCGDTCFGRFLDIRMKDVGSKTGILYDIADDCRNYEEFRQKLDKLREVTTCGKASIENSLILSTVHSSKGLEYDNVYIIDVKDGEFPCVESPDHCLEHEIATLEEERRLFYVAVTRARKRVKITRYALEFDTSVCPPSSFLRELMRYDARAFGFNTEKMKKDAVMRPVKKYIDVSGFVPGAVIVHKMYGRGFIDHTDGDKCRVVFEDGTEKMLSLSVAVDAGVIGLGK